MQATGLLVIGLLFVISLIELAHLPSPGSVLAHCAGVLKIACSQGATSSDIVDVWRGLAISSLYLLLCFSSRRPSASY